ncbi:MAG: DNA-directed RNA polymerase subunit delta [Bacilli bacterium]|nr:DNA-directed RNA polymerase subunit delta [Bacilli bacterium]
MKFKNKTIEELEVMSFDDLAYEILKEKGKKMKTADIFKIICEILNLSESEFEAQIADFFTLLATEKRFIQLEKGFWDLRENHTAKIELEEVEDEEEEILEETEETEESEEDDLYLDETKDADDDDTEDDLKDLVVLDEENEVDL